MKSILLSTIAILAASGSAFASDLHPSYRPIKCELQQRTSIAEPFKTINAGILEYKPRQGTTLTLFSDDSVHIGCSRSWRYNQVPQGTYSPSVRCGFSGNSYYGKANEMPVEIMKVYNGSEYKLVCDVAD